MAELLAGALLAIALAGRGPLRGLPREIVALAGLVGLILTLIWWNTVAQTSSWLFSGGLALYAGVSALIVAAAVAPVGPVRSLLSWELPAASGSSPTARTSTTGRCSSGSASSGSTWPNGRCSSSGLP